MPNHAKQGKHFLFPIGCLRLGKALHEVTATDRSIVLTRAIDWHLHDFMQTIDSEDPQVVAAAEDEAIEHDYTTTNDEWSDDEVRFLFTSRCCPVFHSEKCLPKLLKRIERSVNEVNIGLSRVSIPCELFWKAVEKWEYREFAVLCSVWSAIGQAAYRRVTYDKIVRGAYGYCTEKEFAAKPKSLETLSRQQVRSTIDRLEKRGFFVRCPFTRRHTAYSRRLSLDSLIESIAKRKASETAPTMHQRLKEVERRRNEK
ncbi:MAG: hypothetical protein J0M26_05900 [Planctomycetes bacterium]|nr:hypothetical protein [Planctomycetota bacterium]